MLTDQTASPNCYLDSGTDGGNDQLWSAAQVSIFYVVSNLITPFYSKICFDWLITNVINMKFGHIQPSLGEYA